MHWLVLFVIKKSFTPVAIFHSRLVFNAAVNASSGVHDYLLVILVDLGMASMPSDLNEDDGDSVGLPSALEDASSLSSSLDDSAEPMELDDASSLPPSLDVGTDGVNVFDETDDIINDVLESRQFALMYKPDACRVPGPSAILCCMPKQDVIEMFSPPRVLPRSRELGLSGEFSMDILTGLNFLDPSARKQSLYILDKFAIGLLITCPPCTVFSDLQRLWNFKQMCQTKVQNM